MSQKTNDADVPKLNIYDTEIENGIFNMIVSLCQHKSQTVGMEQAKDDVANWLERIVSGLREEDPDQSVPTG